MTVAQGDNQPVSGRGWRLTWSPISQSLYLDAMVLTTESIGVYVFMSEGVRKHSRYFCCHIPSLLKILQQN